MKAIVYRDYGSPGVLKCEETAKPTPRDDEVLLKIRAASVNPYDWHFMRGEPYLLRIAAGLRKPKNTRLGVDVAGHVEAVGRKVTQFKPRDEVFGSCPGAFAEYACTPESKVVLKPDNVTFDQAASVPIAGLTALQGLRDQGKIQPGQKVLINGAAGGVGTFAVQIAKSFGADVTGVCSMRNLQLVRSIGADHVIDYTQEDFTKGDRAYDLILDCVGNHSLSACRRVLSPNGTYLIVGGQTGPWMIGFLARLLQALVLSRFVSQNFVIVPAKLNKADLTAIAELMKAGKVTPVIDRRYPVGQIADAIAYLEQGHARGKVVIAMQ